MIGSGTLRFQDLKKLLDENSWVEEIELSNWGEIFLNPQLLQIMEYAFQKGVKLYAENGVNLNNVKPEVLEGLVKYQMQRMTCSIDGASQETYSIYRVRGNFDAVIENVRTINRFKEQYSSEFPKLRWQFVIFGHNEHEIASAKALAKELGMDFQCKLSWDAGFSPIKDKEHVRAESGINACDREEYEKVNNVRYMQKSLCGQLWFRPQINYDGAVLGCCVNRWGDFGNAFEDGLEPALNGDKMNYARSMLRGEVPARDDMPCLQCNHYQWMTKNNSFLTDADVATEGAKAPAASLPGALKKKNSFLERLAGQVRGIFSS
ncbi:MAG: SPASM domain-containing protein [Candidatus Obscuribacterales bacterium]|nr:SPASM domain-containing protein [Candidatus Obscuribacterales bacterium]